jgi:hypothetical protein
VLSRSLFVLFFFGHCSVCPEALIEEEQTIQWSNEKEQKDTLNDPQNITQNTKD